MRSSILMWRAIQAHGHQECIMVLKILRKRGSIKSRKAAWNHPT